MRQPYWIISDQDIKYTISRRVHVYNEHSNAKSAMTTSYDTIQWLVMYSFSMVLKATFNNMSLYHGSQFYWWRKPGYREKRKPPTSRKSLTNFYHIILMLYRFHLAWAGFELTTLAVTGTDCIGNPTQLPYDHNQDPVQFRFWEKLFIFLQSLVLKLFSCGVNHPGFPKQSF